MLLGSNVLKWEEANWRLKFYWCSSSQDKFQLTKQVFLGRNILWSYQGIHRQCLERLNLYRQDASVLRLSIIFWSFLPFRLYHQDLWKPLQALKEGWHHLQDLQKLCSNHLQHTSRGHEMFLIGLQNNLSHWVKRLVHVQLKLKRK